MPSIAIAARNPQDSDFLKEHLKDCPDNPEYGFLSYSFVMVAHDTHQQTIKAKIAYLHRRSETLYESKKNSPLEHIGIIFVALVVGRPLQALCKTAYHLFIPLSFYKEIKFALAKDQKLAQKNPGQPRSSRALICTAAILRSLADIIRTPLYGIVLTVIAIAGAILFLIPSKRHYILNVRDLSGLVERSLMWGDKSRCLARCQQPLDTLQTVHQRNKDFSGEKLPFDIQIIGKPGTLEYGLSQLAASQYVFKYKLNRLSKLDTCLVIMHRFGC